MKKKIPAQSGIFNLRVVASVALISIGVSFAYASLAAAPHRKAIRRALNRIGVVQDAPSQPPFVPVSNVVTNGGLTVTAKVFTPGGWVKPGDTFPIVLLYQAGGTGASGATIRVTLHASSIFIQSTPAPDSTSGSTLTYTLGTVLANASGQIVLEARAKTLVEDPEVMWKDVSADVTLQTTLQPALPARTHGPKVTTLTTARYGDRPFPVVMVQYQDVKHCIGPNLRGPAPGIPDPSCGSDHTAGALDTAMNSRSSGKSVWQLFQDMSFGQLFVDAKVIPAPNSPDTPYTLTYPYKWSKLDPEGGCTGITTAPPTGTGVPASLNRIEGGWYQLPGQQGYYGSDKTGHGAVGLQIQQGLLAGIDDACGPTGKAAYDSAAIADEDIDYNDFDTDKDGMVDFFNLVFAGDGGNLSVTPTGLNNIWPHSSDLRQYFKDTDGQTGYVSNDQFRNRFNQPMYFTDATRKVMTTDPSSGIKVFVRVGPYNVNPESAIDSVSVIAHEYGHSLGLPDFYSTGGRGTFGSWELMGSDHFQYMTVFSRQDLGWVVPRPMRDGPITLTESKFDTGQIHWNRPDGTPYTLTGPGIHNADVYRLGLPPRILIDETPSGVRAWYSGAGNGFGCPVDGGGHNLDVFVPDLEQHAGATAVTLKFKHLYEMEWDYDYGFVLVSEDNGVTWTALQSQAGSTIDGLTWNPNNNQCQTTYRYGITGVSDGQANAINNPNRINQAYPPAIFVDDQYDLTPYKGKTIILRFSYATDPGLAKRGWFIDDIEIKADDTVVYASDFEADEERARLFPDGWSWVSSSEGSPADHAYYLELRARLSNDFDGKGQSERGAPGWEGGVSMIYTDEAHGYGNFGVDDPPAQTPVDSTPDPGNESPNLNDAAFTMARPTFDGCTHIENYDAEPGSGTSIPWKLPPHLKFTVTGISGLTQGAAFPASPATATLNADIYPECAPSVDPPLLSIGAGYENPDTDGQYQLTWVRPAVAVGPDLLEVADSCGPTFFDDASETLVAGENANWAGSPQWVTQPDPNDASNTMYFIPDGADQNESLTLKTPVVIPAGYTSTLTFDTRQGLEAGYDFGFVEVSTNGGGSWQSMASYSGPAGLGGTPLDVFEGQRVVNLSEFAGQSVLVRFRVESDGYNEGAPAGWYIDNIAITNSNWTKVVDTDALSFVDHKPTGNYCYRVASTVGVGAAAVRTPFSNVVNVTVAPGVPRIVSRKVHDAQQFDVLLPNSGNPGVECRTGGANGEFTLVYTFGSAIQATAGATVTEGQGIISSSGIGPEPTQYTVNLTGVPNVQYLGVTLQGVEFADSPTLNNVLGRMGVLLGDVNSSRVVTTADVNAVRGQSSRPLAEDNFRADLNLSGVITTLDVNMTRAQSSVALPPP